jgi:hypothetical protein
MFVLDKGGGRKIKGAEGMHHRGTELTEISMVFSPK